MSEKKMEKFTLDQNSEYWEDPKTRSLIDLNFKQLEIDFILKYISKNDVVADVGCGDGVTVCEIASKVKKIIGIERSNYLKDKAKKNLKKYDIKNVKIENGDILELDYQQQFDIAVTERVIINLPSWKHQLTAISNIYNILKPNGIYIMIENTVDGAVALNQLREMVGLKPIDIHWHNLYLDYEQFSNGIQGKFEIIERKGFPLYYLLTRIYIQMFASFDGFGIHAKKDDIFTISDKAAKEIQDKMHNYFSFSENDNILGPIQCFALKKIK
jgi:ubiquinone/menaquinone biosynthesis C-methylase UbiE